MGAEERGETVKGDAPPCTPAGTANWRHLTLAYRKEIPVKILALILALAILVIAHSADMKDRRFNGHVRGCACDTCCYEGYLPITNPSGPDYAR
jgi:hypothetical protein